MIPAVKPTTVWNLERLTLSEGICPRSQRTLARVPTAGAGVGGRLERLAVISDSPHQASGMPTVGGLELLHFVWRAWREQPEDGDCEQASLTAGLRCGFLGVKRRGRRRCDTLLPEWGDALSSELLRALAASASKDWQSRQRGRSLVREERSR